MSTTPVVAPEREWWTNGDDVSWCVEIECHHDCPISWCPSRLRFNTRLLALQFATMRRLFCLDSDIAHYRSLTLPLDAQGAVDELFALGRTLQAPVETTDEFLTEFETKFQHMSDALVARGVWHKDWKPPQVCATRVTKCFVFPWPTNWEFVDHAPNIAVVRAVVDYSIALSIRSSSAIVSSRAVLSLG